MSETIKHYENRQADYTHGYEMKFCRESAGYFAIWCLVHPADPHDKGVSHHHLYTTGKLCQRDGYESRTFEHAEAFAFWWMKRWSVYVRTGMFPMTAEAINVPERR